jgi:hypothetical protein
VQKGQKLPGQVVPATTKPVQPEVLPVKQTVMGGQEGLSSEPIIDPVQKIIQAIKEAKPIRGQQEKLYSIERGKRVARVAAMGNKVPGEQGFYSQLGQLKGALPKVSYESIRGKITQPDIDALFNKVQQFPMSEFEKITAKSGLAKMLGAEGGAVPNRSELQLLSEVFPPEFVQSVLSQRPAMQKLFALGEEVLNLPRAIMATADLSAPLRQGVFLIGKPKTWIPAFGSMFKYFASEKSYKGLSDQIKSRPTYQLMRDSKLALTDMSPLLQSREEAFMSNLSEKIPGFGILAKASNRAYSGFLNKLRADTFDDLVRTAKQQGIDKENPKVIADIAKFVNSATGRGDLGALNKASVVLNGAFFSPRLMASRLNLINPKYYMDLEPMVRKEALKSLFTFAGTGASILGLAKLGGAQVGIDPRSADFGKIKIDDTRYDIWGGFQQYMVLAARLLSNQMVSSTTGKEFNLGEGYKPTTRMDILQRFFESKTAPVASFALALLRGQNSMGEKTNLPVELVDRFIPMVVQDMYDLVRERGAQGIYMAIPGMFGVGSQTYTDQIPMNAKTPTGKPKIAWRQAPGLGETILNKVTGTKVSDIPQEQWGPLVEKKQQDALTAIEMQKVKATVLETGQPQTFNNKLIYVDKGILKTKDLTPKKTTEKATTVKKTATKKSKAAKKITITKAKTTKIKIKKVALKAKKLPRLKLAKSKKLKTLASTAKVTKGKTYKFSAKAPIKVQKYA